MILTGLILFAFSTTGFIVFLVLSESPDCNHQTTAVTLNDVIEIIILLVMIAVSVYVSVTKNQLKMFFANFNKIKPIINALTFH